MKYNNIVKTPNTFLAITGYTQEEFNALLPYFEKELSEVKYTLEGIPRKNKASKYKNSVLPLSEDKLLFILTYLKQYTTQIMLATIFAMSQPKANLWIHYLTPILKSTLFQAGVAPVREMNKLPEKESIVFAHDGTERPIQRPKNKDTQKKYYSGKKKSHTVKNNILANEICEIIFLTSTVEGKKHDKKLADESTYNLPSGSILLQDTGFQGFSLKDIQIMQPKKKPRGKELTEEDKVLNREISKIRVRIEHVMSGIKRYRILKDKCRNWLKGFKDQIMEISCGLHNFRLKFRPWKKMEFLTTSV